MEKPYTHTTWRVKAGSEDEFVRRWSEWVDWSHREGLEAPALLLRDLDSPRAFISFGPLGEHGGRQELACPRRLPRTGGTTQRGTRQLRAPNARDRSPALDTESLNRPRACAIGYVRMIKIRPARKPSFSPAGLGSASRLCGTSASQLHQRATVSSREAVVGYEPWVWVPKTRFPCESGHSREAVRVLGLATAGCGRLMC
jgi:hypothetical protein